MFFNQKLYVYFESYICSVPVALQLTLCGLTLGDSTLLNLTTIYNLAAVSYADIIHCHDTVNV